MYGNRFLTTHLYKRELNLAYTFHSNRKGDICNGVKYKIQQDTKNCNSNRRIKSIFNIKKSGKLQLKLKIYITGLS